MLQEVPYQNVDLQKLEKWNLVNLKMSDIEKHKKSQDLGKRTGFVSFSRWYKSTPKIHHRSTQKCVNIASNINFSDSEDSDEENEEFQSDSSFSSLIETEEEIDDTTILGQVDTEIQKNETKKSDKALENVGLVPKILKWSFSSEINLQSKSSMRIFLEHFLRGQKVLCTSYLLFSGVMDNIVSSLKRNIQSRNTTFENQYLLDFLSQVIKMNKFGYILFIKYLEKHHIEEQFNNLILRNLTDSNVLVRSLFLTMRQILKKQYQNSEIKNWNFLNYEFWRDDGQHSEEKDLFTLPILNSIMHHNSASNIQKPLPKWIKSSTFTHLIFKLDSILNLLIIPLLENGLDRNSKPTLILFLQFRLVYLQISNLSLDLCCLNTFFMILIMLKHDCESEKYQKFLRNQVLLLKKQSNIDKMKELLLQWEYNYLDNPNELLQFEYQNGIHAVEYRIIRNEVLSLLVKVELKP